MKIVKIGDKFGIVMIPSKSLKRVFDLKTNEDVEVKTLNNVLLEDGTIKAVGDDEMEVIEDDWTEETTSEGK